MAKGRFIKLLILLLGLLALSPLFEEFFQLRVLEGLFFTAIFIYAAYSFNHDKRLLTAAVTLALPAIASMWLKPYVQAKWLTISGELCGTMFVAIITIAFIVHIFHQKDINADTIAGAIVAYLLMALMWSLLYGVLEAAHPGAFKFPEGTIQIRQEIFTYFSFVTITTVGYGSIVPVFPAARAFANLEAVVGQLYLVILVSWLMGMYVSKKSK